MKALLDTHALLWWLDGDRRLSAGARTVIESDTSDIYVSAASVWEIATKVRIGKLPRAQSIARRLPEAIASQGFIPMSISILDAGRAGAISSPHRDPFDRMLAAQSQARAIPIVTSDPAFATLGVEMIW